MYIWNKYMSVYFICCICENRHIIHVCMVYKKYIYLNRKCSNRYFFMFYTYVYVFVHGPALISISTLHFILPGYCASWNEMKHCFSKARLLVLHALHLLPFVLSTESTPLELKAGIGAGEDLFVRFISTYSDSIKWWGNGCTFHTLFTVESLEHLQKRNL